MARADIAAMCVRVRLTVRLRNIVAALKIEFLTLFVELHYTLQKCGDCVNYHPLVARLMSADPIIQDPEHSQSYNRYTYVWNNPTNLTDPTGFAVITSAGTIITSDGSTLGCTSGGTLVHCGIVEKHSSSWSR
jgi:hypothetical protein